MFIYFLICYNLLGLLYSSCSSLPNVVTANAKQVTHHPAKSSMPRHRVQHSDWTYHFHRRDHHGDKPPETEIAINHPRGELLFLHGVIPQFICPNTGPLIVDLDKPSLQPRQDKRLPLQSRRTEQPRSRLGINFSNTAPLRAGSTVPHSQTAQPSKWRNLAHRRL